MVSLSVYLKSGYCRSANLPKKKVRTAINNRVYQGVAPFLGSTQLNWGAFSKSSREN